MKRISFVLVLSFFFRAAVAQSPNILLITLDTTRADHIGCYGGKNVSTPNIDALAAKGVLFEEARAHCPLTLPSHANILTGKLPSTLNLRVNGMAINEKIPQIQETFKSSGYRTIAVVSSVILEKTRGLSRGFDVYNDKMTAGAGGSLIERRAEETTAAALAEIGSAGSPYFMWVQYFDPHYEYRPPAPYSRTFKDSLYDGEIAYMDAQIGALLKGLSERNLLADTLIVIAGDHGEGLMEHKELQHGLFLYEYAIHVPMIMVFEGRIPAGKRCSGLCALSDIAPTIFDLLALKGSGFDGRSLVPMFSDGKREEKPVYIESYYGYLSYGWAPLRGIVDKDYKFIDAPKPELYRYRVSEDNNLFIQEPKVTSAMRNELRKYPAADAVEKKAAEDFLKDPSNSETLRQLMSLGYLSGPEMRPDQPGLIDPKDGIGIEEELHKAVEAKDAGKLEEAQKLFLAILKKNPANIPALTLLGETYLSGNKLDEAMACFKQEIVLKPQAYGAHFDLGRVYQRKGSVALAEKEYRAALTVNPRMAEAVVALSQIFIDQKRFKEAKEFLSAAIADQAESADIYYNAGLVSVAESDYGKARSFFARSVSINPMKHEANANLGQMAIQDGRIDDAIFYYERALKAAPGRDDYYTSLGSLHLIGKNDIDKAIFCFKKAVALNPDGARAVELKEMIISLEAEKSGTAQ
jgi:choline-sulfatase